MPDRDPVDEAIDLAEQILEEVTRSAQDWPAIEHLADALAKLAAQAGGGSGR